jgi:cobalt-precorrin 5A hydrolase / precorrin-3B C17-methyltransferase
MRGSRVLEVMAYQAEEATTNHQPSTINHQPSTTNHPMLPITLTNLNNVLAVVVGGGPVGERKVRGVLEAGGRVRLIAPEATAQLAAWAKSGEIEWLQRAYQPGDLQDARLVFAATNLREVNRAVAVEADQRGLLINVADVPAEGNFHMPAIHRSDEVIIAVSSHSGRPRLAQKVRDWIAGLLAKGNVD